MSSESSWIDFTAGWISGGISTLAIQPVDTILTRMQANVSIHHQNVAPSSSTLNKVAATQVSSAAATSSSASSAMTVRPTSIFRGMISNFGITSLWRGSSAMIGAVPIQNAVLMNGYGYGKRWTTGSDDDDDDVENNDSSSSSRSDVLLGVFMGGCVGGILQSFVMSPIELIKVTQQVIGKSGLAATSSVISGLFKPTTFTSSSSSSGGGGGRGSATTSTISAWRGLGATLLRDGIPHGVWFASYEYAKVELTKYKQQNDINNNNNDDERRSSSSTEDEIVIPMLSGAFAATTAWGIGYPFDLIKTRIQAGTSTGGIISTAKDIINESSSSDNGGRAFYGLYRGFGLKLIRSIPASAIGFLVYETAAKALSSRV